MGTSTALLPAILGQVSTKSATGAIKVDTCYPKHRKTLKTRGRCPEILRRMAILWTPVSEDPRKPEGSLGMVSRWAWDGYGVGAVAAGIYDFRRRQRVINVQAVSRCDWMCLGAPPPPITVVGGCKTSGSESPHGSPTRPLAARSSRGDRKKRDARHLPDTTYTSSRPRQQAWRREPPRRARRRPLACTRRAP